LYYYCRKHSNISYTKLEVLIKNNLTSSRSSDITRHILIAVVAVLILVMLLLYRLNRSDAELKSQINQMTPKLERTAVSLLEAKRNIDSLNAIMLSYKDNFTILTKERDSLLHLFKKQAAANLASMQNDLIKQRENKELNLLKERNKDYK